MAEKKGKLITMAEALRRKATDAKPEDLPIEGMEATYIHVEKGYRPSVSRRAAAKIVRMSAAFYGSSRYVDYLSGKQTKRDEAIKAFGEEHAGFRGIVSDSGPPRRKFKLSAYPRTSITWNPDAAENQLGPAYSAIFSEDTVVTVTVPAGYRTEQGALTHRRIKLAIEAGLLAIKIPEEDLPLLVKADRVVRNDDPEKLHGLVQDGLIKDVESLGEARETWAIKLYDRQNGGELNIPPETQAAPPAL